MSRAALWGCLALSLALNGVLSFRVLAPRQWNAFVLSFQPGPDVESGDHVRGPADARAEVIVYTDYQCPYCTRLHAAIQEVAQDTEFRLVYRHFPLEMHTMAQRAAEAAECAGEQQRFWEYTDALFRPKGPLTEERLTEIAAGVGLDGEAFAGCLSSGRFEDKLKAHHADALGRRLQVVPTFFVNGTRYTGLVPADRLRQIVREAAG